MENFNKVISFILGLVVVIVFFAVVSGRLNLRQKVPFLSKGVSPTPTPTKVGMINPTPISRTRVDSVYTRYQVSQEKTPTTIPATGSPTIFLPLLFSGLATGYFLLSKSRNL